MKKKGNQLTQRSKPKLSTSVHHTTTPLQFSRERKELQIHKQ